MKTRMLAPLGICALTLLATACGDDDPTSPPEEFSYSENFATGADSEWSNPQTTTSPSGQRFLGTFSIGSTALSLSDLPAHSTVTIEFDLYVIGSWNGNSDPDVLTFSHSGGTTLMAATFANQDNDMQTWPQAHPGGNNPRATGAFATNSLGYPPQDNGELGDSSYRVSFTIPHTAATFQFQVAASQTSDQEFWGIDNVEVTLD